MNNKKIILFILLIWPFLYLLPLTTGLIAMGNDFDLVYYSYKKYIFELFAEGYAPLWSPYEGIGYSLIYNPFASYFYIPGWINFLFLIVKGTFSLQDYLIFTISGVSIFNLGLYLWLIRFRFNTLENLFVVLIISSCLLITGFLRFPNAIHSLAWFPYVLLGMDLALKKKFIKSSLIIFFSYLFIITAGYPYFLIYFSFFIFIYFFFTFFYEKLFDKDYENISIIKYAFNLTPSFFFAILISSPWLLGIKKVLNLTTDRNIANFEFATLNEFNFVDIIGSWIYPLASNTDGRYYLGLFFTLIIFTYLLTIFSYKKIEKKETYLLSSLIIFFIFISLIAAGSKSFLFTFLWNNIEFIQQLRTWPRINILLIPFFSLLLSLSLRHLMRTEFLERDLNIKIKGIYIIFLILLFILITQIILFYNGIESGYWKTWHEKRFLYASEFLGFPFSYILSLFDGKIHILTSLGLFIVFLFILKNSNFFLKNRTYFFNIFLIFTTFELFIISNLQWSLLEWKTKNTDKSINIKKSIVKSNLKSRELYYIFGNEFIRSEVYQVNNFANWGYNAHESILRKYYKLNGTKKKNISVKDIENFNFFFGIDDNNKRVFLTKNINHDNIDNFIADNKLFESEINFLEINWNKYFGNEIQIKTNLNESGWLTFVDNFDPFWEAYIDNKPVKIHKFLNAYKSIKIDSGKKIIKFKYSPFNMRKLYFK